MGRRLVCIAAILLGVAVWLPQTASAHALPVSSSPAEGATVQESPSQVEITFGETPDPKLSTITVADSAGSAVQQGATSAVAGHPEELRAAVKNLPHGVYTVTWKTVSSIDGHLAAGSFAFGVGVSATSANAKARSAVQSPAPSVLAIASRWVFFISVLSILGLASTSLVALRDVPVISRRVLNTSWCGLMLSSLGIVESQREAASIPWSQMLNVTVGATAIWRAVAVGVTGIVIAAFNVGGNRLQRTALWSAGGASLFTLAVEVGSSHAGARAPVGPNLVLQWVHIAAAGVWIGGLGALLLAMRGMLSEQRQSAARRFSFLAGFCIALVGITGLVRAILEIPSWAAVFNTAFGILVLVKVALFLVLAALGWMNRYRNVRADHFAVHKMRRVGSIEVGVAVVVLLVAASLVNVPPPPRLVVQSGQQSQPVVVSGADFATTMRLTLTVSPGSAGFNTFSAHVTAFDSGDAVKATDVVLRFDNPLRPQLGSSSLVLKSQGDGTFAASGANLAIAGTWEIVAVVEAGVQSAEVDLQMTTNTPAPPVQSTVVGSGQALYTIQLTNGRSVQVYLDPGKPGANDFHMTFFDATGNELAVSQDSAGMTVAGGKPTLLTVRPLDTVGHYVARVADLRAGRTRFDIFGTTPQGEMLSAFVTIPVS